MHLHSLVRGGLRHYRNCQPIAAMTSVSVAPFFRRIRAITAAFLLPPSDAPGLFFPFVFVPTRASGRLLLWCAQCANLRGC